MRIWEVYHRLNGKSFDFFYTLEEAVACAKRGKFMGVRLGVFSPTN